MNKKEKRALFLSLAIFRRFRLLLRIVSTKPKVVQTFKIKKCYKKTPK